MFGSKTLGFPVSSSWLSSQHGSWAPMWGGWFLATSTCSVLLLLQRFLQQDRWQVEGFVAQLVSMSLFPQPAEYLPTSESRMKEWRLPACTSSSSLPSQHSMSWMEIVSQQWSPLLSDIRGWSILAPAWIVWGSPGGSPQPTTQQGITQSYAGSLAWLQKRSSSLPCISVCSFTRSLHQGHPHICQEISITVGVLAALRIPTNYICLPCIHFFHPTLTNPIFPVPVPRLRSPPTDSFPRR